MSLIVSCNASSSAILIFTPYSESKLKIERIAFWYFDQRSYLLNCINHHHQPSPTDPGFCMRDLSGSRSFVKRLFAKIKSAFPPPTTYMTSPKPFRWRSVQFEFLAKWKRLSFHNLPIATVLISPCRQGEYIDTFQVISHHSNQEEGFFHQLGSSRRIRLLDPSARGAWRV